MKIHTFNECLLFGNIGEELVKKKIGRFVAPLLKTYGYGDSKEATAKQLNGVDFNINLSNLETDVKIRSNGYWKYRDILLETYSNLELDKPGWFYTSQSDIIFYCWANDRCTELVAAYALILKPTRLFIKEYLIHNKVKTTTAHTYTNWAKKEYYTTKGILVPIAEFPPELLIPINLSNFQEHLIIDIPS